MNIDQLQTTPPDIYATGVTRKWVIDYPLVMISVPDIKRETVDDWFHVCKTTIEEFKGPTLFAFHDMANEHIAMTPYSQAKARELLMLRPELQVYTALHVKKTLIAQFISAFLRRIYTHQKTQVFFEKEVAMNWLLQHIKVSSEATHGKLD